MGSSNRALGRGGSIIARRSKALTCVKFAKGDATKLNYQKGPIIKGYAIIATVALHAQGADSAI